jgi:hypothetical protein
MHLVEVALNEDIGAFHVLLLLFKIGLIGQILEHLRDQHQPPPTLALELLVDQPERVGRHQGGAQPPEGPS